MKFPILHLLLLLLCGAACGGKKEEAAVVTTTTKTTNDRVFGIARVEPEDGITDLVAGTSGKVLTVLIDENQSIKQGQTLITVDQSVEKSQLLQAKSKIGPQTAAITTQRANVETLKINLRNAQTILQRNTALFNGKALTKEELDNSQFEVDRYQRNCRSRSKSSGSQQQN
jgi:multidrug resistance efflux pump